MYGTKGLNQFFRWPEASEVLSVSTGLSCWFYGWIRGTHKTSLHCIQGWRYPMEKNVNCL